MLMTEVIAVVMLMMLLIEMFYCTKFSVQSLHWTVDSGFFFF